MTLHRSLRDDILRPKDGSLVGIFDSCRPQYATRQVSGTHLHLIYAATLFYTHFDFIIITDIKQRFHGNPSRQHVLLCLLKAFLIQGGSNMTGTDLYVNKTHCAVAVRPWESEATTSTLPPARVRTCSVLSGSC